MPAGYARHCNFYLRLCAHVFVVHCFYIQLLCEVLVVASQARDAWAAAGLEGPVQRCLPAALTPASDTVPVQVSLGTPTHRLL